MRTGTGMLALALLSAAVGLTTGCGLGTVALEPTGLAAEVAERAVDVADQIGGEDGFGGTWMNGYVDHMPMHMGFHGMAYLADEDGTVTIEVVNDAAPAAVVHVVYLTTAEGELTEQTVEVEVEGYGTVSIDVPCAEIVGVGALDDVGATAADLDDATALPNDFCVPAFLNADYVCGGVYAIYVGADEDDLDEDGDTEETVITTEALQTHMGPGGMSGSGHMYGMMGLDEDGFVPGGLGGMMGGLFGPGGM